MAHDGGLNSQSNGCSWYPFAAPSGAIIIATYAAASAEYSHTFDSATSHPSATSSAPAPTSILCSSPKPTADTASKAAGRPSHSHRSYIGYRRRKAKCELTDLTIPSSSDQLPSSLKCHGCRALKADCIVWEGDTKVRECKAPRYGSPFTDSSQTLKEQHTLKRMASITSIKSGERETLAVEKRDRSTRQRAIL